MGTSRQPPCPRPHEAEEIEGVMTMTVLIWIATVLLVPAAILTGWCAVASARNVIWTLRARDIGQERASRRTESARGTVDGGGPVLIPGCMMVAHATWEGEDGEQHVAIGPVISDVRNSDENVTRIDGTVLCVSDEDWQRVLYHRSEVRRLRYTRGGPYVYMQEPPELAVARGKSLSAPSLTPNPPLSVDKAAMWKWDGLPLATMLPYGTEVEVRYDPACPDDARVMCAGSVDGTFVCKRDILRAAVSLAYRTLLFVAEVALIYALHNGATAAWVVAVCTGVVGLALRHVCHRIFPLT